MKPVNRKAWGARSFWAVIITIAVVVIIAGLVGGICWQQHVAKERVQPAPATAATPAKTGQDSATVNAPVPAGTGREASPAPMPVSSLLFPYGGKEELHPFKDYLGKGDIPACHFAIDGSNRIYILGSSPGILVIDPARKSRKVLPLPVKPWQGFTAFSPDMKSNSIYFLITQGVARENEIILLRTEMVNAKLEPREEIRIDIPPADLRDLAVEGEDNQILVADHKVYVYNSMSSHLLATTKNGFLEVE